jgi:histidyl-tRNA synthetase
LLAAIIGDDEAAADQVTIKPLREEQAQQRVARSELSDHVGQYLFAEDDNGNV